MEEGAVEGRHGGRGDERVADSLARRKASGARSGETETDGIRAPGVCTLFRVSARTGNMTAVTSA